MATKNLLVFPTDFSERSLSALPWVRKMAESLQADTHCIYVVEEPQIYGTLDMGPVAIPSVQELVASAESRLDSFIKTNLKAFGSAPKASGGQAPAARKHDGGCPPPRELSGAVDPDGLICVD
jgi:hypothetical protein